MNANQRVIAATHGVKLPSNIAPYSGHIVTVVEKGEKHSTVSVGGIKLPTPIPNQFLFYMRG